jgi:hypothetical protein
MKKKIDNDKPKTFTEHRKSPPSKAIQKAIDKKKVAPVVVKPVKKKIEVGIAFFKKETKFYCKNNYTGDTWYVEDIVTFFSECFKEKFGRLYVRDLEDIYFTNTEVENLFNKIIKIEDSSITLLGNYTE